MVRPGAGTAAVQSRHAKAVENRDHLWGIAPLTGGDQHGQRPQTALTSQVNLRCQAAARTAQRLVGAVLSGPGALARFPWRLLACADGVLMSTPHCGVHTHHGPVDPAIRVGLGLDGPDDPLPSAIRGPPPVPVVTGLPAPEPRQ